MASDRDLKDILRLRERLERVWRPYWAKVNLLEQYRHQEHPISIPPVYRKTTHEVRTPYVPDVGRRVGAILTANYPLIRVEPRSTGDDELARANRKERWTPAVLLQLERQRKRRVWRYSLDSAINYGLGIMKLFWWPEAWKGRGLGRQEGEEDESFLGRKEGRKKELALPFVWTDVDPRSFLPRYNEGGLAEVIQVSQRDPHDLGRRYGLNPRDLLGGRSSAQEEAPGAVPVLEYWDEARVVYVAPQAGRGKGMVLEEISHGLGRAPYFPFAGLSTAAEDPAHAYQGIMEQILPMVLLADRLLTIELNWVTVAGMPMIVTERPEGSLPDGGAPALGDEDQPDAEEDTLTFEAGAAVEVRGKTYFLSPPPVGQDLSRLTQFAIQTIAEYGGIVPVLRGLGGYDQPGYAVAQLRTAARQLFDPIMDNAALALEEMVGFLWRLVEIKAKERVWVLGEDQAAGKRSWLSLGPEDVDGYYQAEVRINPLLPTDRIALGQFGLSQVGAGAQSMKRHREEMGWDAVQEEEDVEFERQKKLGVVQQALDTLTLRKAGILDVVQASEGGGGNGGVPAEGGPAGPLVPTPGLGMPLTQPRPPGPGGRAQGLRGGRAAGVARQPPQGVPTGGE